MLDLKHTLCCGQDGTNRLNVLFSLFSLSQNNEPSILLSQPQSSSSSIWTCTAESNLDVDFSYYHPNNEQRLCRSRELINYPRSVLLDVHKSFNLGSLLSHWTIFTGWLEPKIGLLLLEFDPPQRFSSWFLTSVLLLISTLLLVCSPPLLLFWFLLCPGLFTIRSCLWPSPEFDKFEFISERGVVESWSSLLELCVITE